MTEGKAQTHCRMFMELCPVSGEFRKEKMTSGHELAWSSVEKVAFNLDLGESQGGRGGNSRWKQKTSKMGEIASNHTSILFILFWIHGNAGK